MSIRRAVMWRVLLFPVIVTNTVLEMSPAVGEWWGRSSSEDSVLPKVVQEVISSRPDTSEGDLHLVMWFVAGALLVLAVRTWRLRVVALLGLWLYSGVIELLQTWLTTSRSGQWSDFAANALGIGSAATGMAIAERIVQRRLAAQVGRRDGGAPSSTIGVSSPASHHRRSVDHA